jgi:hypothetical protein
MIFGGQPKETAEHNVTFGGQGWANEINKAFLAVFFAIKTSPLFSPAHPGCRKACVVFARQLTTAEINIGHRKTVDFL